MTTINDYNAAQSAFYRQRDPSEPATPEWADLTPAEQQDHRQWCHDTCALCESGRELGVFCPGCGSTAAEAMNGKTVCCDARPLLGDDAERGWAA